MRWCVQVCEGVYRYVRCDGVYRYDMVCTGM